MLVTFFQRYEKKKKKKKKSVHYKTLEANWNFTDCQVLQLMIVLIPCINLLNLFCIIKYMYWVNVEHLTQST